MIVASASVIASERRISVISSVVSSVAKGRWVLMLLLLDTVYDDTRLLAIHSCYVTTASLLGHYC